MGDTASSTSVDAQQTIDEQREPLPRQIYLALRLKEIVAALRSMTAERQSLNAILKDRGGEASKDVRKMRERRGYLAIRINILRAEQQDLVTEKDALSPVMKSFAGAGKSNSRLA
jgi:hypothetical protein